MYLHNDEVLYDPLPQPYRFVNKILLRCIQDAIDLAESGEAEALNSIISHNLRLTKVGKIPTINMSDFFLSTTIANHEITTYSLIGNTQFLVCGTSQSLIVICDIISKSIVYTLNITTLSKFAQLKPIVHLLSFETDHNNYVVVFATEDIGFILFISSAFVLRSSIEIDISLFNFDSFELKQGSDPYITLTDGTGRTCVYNCHTPNELIAAESTAAQPAKAAQSRPVQLDPILELEKCPISTGPVSSEAQLATKTEEPSSKKRPAKKKAPVPSKGKQRAKSPGTQAIENITPAETTQYQATVYVLDTVAAIRFGTFPILLLYKLTPSSQLICEFPIPSPITVAVEVVDRQHIIFGFENGSFCFLNVARKTLHDHQFPKQGAIKEIHYYNDLLITLSESKTINAYKLENFKVVQTLLTCSDDDILETHISSDSIYTYNQKSSDIHLVHALTQTITWEEREMKLFPNCSIIQAQTGCYSGTISTPISIELVSTLWNKTFGVFIYNDPVEYRLATPNRGQSPTHGKRAAPKAGAKPTSGTAKKGKTATRATKKAEEAKETEQEATVVVKRQIIGIVNFEIAQDSFAKTHAAIEKGKNKRREAIKSLSKMNEEEANTTDE